MENLGMLLGLLLFLLFCEVPIAFAIGIITVFSVYQGGVLKIDMITNVMADSLNSFPLLSAPFFILSGVMMNYTNMASQMITWLKVLFGDRVGSSAVLMVIVSAFFSLITGSAVATVAAIGGILMPIMIKEGYRPAFTAALCASAAGLGPIIPPSIGFILIAVIINCSISDLFLAGTFPGILISLALIAMIYYEMKKWGYKEVKVKPRKYTLKEKGAATWDARWAILFPVVILGTIYGGIATPTEAAVISVDYALFVGLFIDKTIKIKSIPPMLLESLMAIGVTVGILACASAFGKVLMVHQIPNKLVELMYGITTIPWLILLMVNVFLLVNGCFVDSTASIIIYTPLLWPICEKAGLDKIAFGSMELTNVVIGLITPPVAVSLFLASAMTGVSIREMLPYVWRNFFTWCACLAVVTYFPEISTWLPAWLNSFKH